MDDQGKEGLNAMIPKCGNDTSCCSDKGLVLAAGGYTHQVRTDARLGV